MYNVGILRGPSLNPYEGQCFKRLPEFGFQPIGITTYDNSFNLSEIPFPIRVGYDFKALTKGKLEKLQRLARKITRYHFESWNFSIYNLKSLIKDINVIHSADIWYPYTYQAVKSGIPTVTSEWENIAFNYEELPFSKIKKYNREHVSHFIAITEKAKKALMIEGVNSERISVIHPGIDCDKFKPAEKSDDAIKKFSLSQEKAKILFVGRLVPEKGIFDLLYAFSALLKNTKNVELLIVGSGSKEIKNEIFKLFTKLNIVDSVKFLGSAPYSVMPQIHNLADVFCLPSVETKTWAEQFGYSMAEAMACGKPVVSTCTGSIPEVVKDRSTGILVEPNNPVKLRSALEELLLDTQEREAFGRNARSWVLQEFEARNIASQLAGIYSKFV